MSTAPTVIQHLLDPVSSEQPAGSDLRWTPDWDRIKEARREDDALESGKWAKKERKSANWTLVRELATAILRDQSKDLQIALWLTEANIKLDRFVGLRDSLGLIRELLVRYWDHGLYPPIEDGPEDRAGPLQWFNDKLIDSVEAIPITVRSDGGTDYSLIDLRDARRVGSEATWRSPDGEIDVVKKREYEAALDAGRISMEMFEKAVKETKRADYEPFHNLFSQTYEEFKLLEKVVDEKFKDAAPNLAACRAAFRDLELEIGEILNKKRKSEPDQTPAVVTQGAGAATPEGASSSPRPAEPIVVRMPLALTSLAGAGSADGGNWEQAEMLIKSGQVDQGLAEMAHLAARETTGRQRFQRKLLLADICLSSKRERLAKSILEELASQIDKFQLDQWESTELIGAVWLRLHQIYIRNEADAERAKTLYERLCKLDPWQALKCGEA